MRRWLEVGDVGAWHSDGIGFIRDFGSERRAHFVAKPRKAAAPPHARRISRRGFHFQPQEILAMPKRLQCSDRNNLTSAKHLRMLTPKDWLVSSVTTILRSTASTTPAGASGN
jgi:hypothetical protein